MRTAFVSIFRVIYGSLVNSLPSATMHTHTRHASTYTHTHTHTHTHSHSLTPSQTQTSVLRTCIQEWQATTLIQLVKIAHIAIYACIHPFGTAGSSFWLFLTYSVLDSFKEWCAPSLTILKAPFKSWGNELSSHRSPKSLRWGQAREKCTNIIAIFGDKLATFRDKLAIFGGKLAALPCGLHFVFLLCS